MKKIMWLLGSGLIALSLISCKPNSLLIATSSGNQTEPAALSPTQQIPGPAGTPAPAPESTPIPKPLTYTLSTSVNPPDSGAVSITHGQYASGARVQVTVVAYAGFAFDHWSGDISGNNSSIILLMGSNKALVANFVDVSPPVISNVVTSNVTDTKITFGWITNEPATSQLEYGLTSAYGSISSDGQLVTSHTLTLSGLTPNTHYFYRVASVDGAGNEGVFTGDVLTVESWMAVTPMVYVQGTTILYNLINNSSQTITITKVEVDDQLGIVRHTDESNTLEVHNIGPLSPGDTLKGSFSLPTIYPNFNGWRVAWFCLKPDLTRFVVTSNPLSP